MTPDEPLATWIGPLRPMLLALAGQLSGAFDALITGPTAMMSSADQIRATVAEASAYLATELGPNARMVSRLERLLERFDLVARSLSSDEGDLGDRYISAIASQVLKLNGEFAVYLADVERMAIGGTVW